MVDLSGASLPWGCPGKKAIKCMSVCVHACVRACNGETEDDLIKRLNERKDNVENRGMKVNMNKTKVIITGEWQKVMHKAVRWPCGVCGRGIGNNSIQCASCQEM